MKIVSNMTGWRTIIFKWRDMGIHIFPDQHYWGYEEEWIDGMYYLFGLGPLLLIVWNDKCS